MPPPDAEAWRAFAESAAGFDPGATITPRVHAAGHAVPPVPRASITVPDLPLLTVDRLHEVRDPGRAAPPGPGSGDADFEVVGLLGEGGMGKVLLARQRSLRREVAIKVVKPGHAGGQLLVEALVTGSVEHPGVIPVHVLGRDAEGRPVLVMKRVEGVSWRALAADPAHPLWSAIAPDAGDRLDAHLEILMAVCSAVHCAHARGFVHRDIKLANVMIGSFGEVYLVDWGIAMRTGTHEDDGHGDLFGTPSYMAPEMVRGDPAHIDARTDVYLLGATLHAVLTGAPRHRGESIVEVLLSARASLPFDYPPDVPAELAALCNRAMSESPADRFGSALDLRLALASFRRHRGSIALGDEASARLAETPSGGDPRRVHGMLTECRFGFMQALRAWPENAAARAGLSRCLAAMIDHEIVQRDAEGARALLADLPSPRPDLAARIEALEADLRAAAGREAELRRLERDRDLSIGAGAQLAVVAILPALSLAVLAYVLDRGAITLSRAELLGAPAFGLAVLLVTAVAARRRLRTEISRKAVAMLVIIPAAIVAHRVLATALGASVPSILGGDLVLAASLTLAMATALVPRFAWTVVPLVLGAATLALRPGAAVPIFAAAVVSALWLLLLVWRRSVRG